MSIIGTFQTARQGMYTHAHGLETISNNIANVNTTAYKREDTRFVTLLNRVAPAAAAGPPKKFFSVQPVDSRQVNAQGILQTTGREFDLAITGEGFFVTNQTLDGQGDFRYTRDGALFGRSVDLDSDTDNDGIPDEGVYLTTTAGQFIYGWPAEEDGSFNTTNDLNALQPVLINTNQLFPAVPTTEMSLQANLSQIGVGAQRVGLPVVDTQGNPQTISLVFNATTSNVFDISASGLEGNQTVPVTLDLSQLEFDGLAQLQQPASGTITATINYSFGPQEVTIDISELTAFGGSDGDVTIQNINTDGVLAGRLDRTFINNEGIVFASFDNGSFREVAQLAIGRFPAPNQLEAITGNQFRQSQFSGAVELGTPGGAAGVSRLVVGALESSNVDLADQFTRMITTQRAYSSSAQVFRTANEMWQQARDLKR